MGNDFNIERVTEKFMELMIQPHLFREINNIVKADKDFFNGVHVEIED